MMQGREFTELSFRICGHLVLSPELSRLFCQLIIIFSLNFLQWLWTYTYESPTSLLDGLINDLVKILVPQTQRKLIKLLALLRLILQTLKPFGLLFHKTKKQQNWEAGTREFLLRKHLITIKLFFCWPINQLMASALQQGSFWTF